MRAIPRQSAAVHCWKLALAASLFVGPWVVGCKGVATLKQRCLTGDTASCESACKKGVPGEGGCFHAGNQHREKASLDYAGTEFRRASEYFVRSCDGGYGDGCLLAAEMIEAPYAPEPASWSSGLPELISDDQVREREKRLGQACSRGSARGCKRLGDVLIGKNAERALVGYRKACDAGAAAADCKTARQSEVAQADKWRVACTHESADDCARLGDLLYRVDPPRGLRLFVSECQLRGVAELVGGVVEFVRGRAASGGEAAAGASAPPLGTSAKYVFDVLTPVVKGPVAVAEVLHAFAAAAPELSACIELDPRPAYPTVGLEWIIDATGDVFRARVTGVAPPGPVARCLEAAVEQMPFSRPPGPATATAELRLRPVNPSRNGAN